MKNIRRQLPRDLIVMRKVRQDAVLGEAAKLGLLAGTNRQLGARIPLTLIDGAKISSGIASTTELIEYALAKVAVEDDFGAYLVTRRGSIPKDFDL